GYSLSAAGGAGTGYTWVLVDPNSLPVGMFLTPDGVIQGTPADGAAGIYNFAVRVTDAQGNTGIKNFSMTVNTEYSDPGVINNLLSDAVSGGGGGCALSTSTSALALVFLALLALVVYRRREQA
ncbi:MAG: putative Ig domain-containing protein, partial [Planctomycetes bacterium]|nr:putative Ig domain-containing protein [Planctomycetota bacterium]